MFFIEFLITFYSLSAAALLFLYKMKYNVWKSRNIRGPLPLPLIGTTLDSYFYNLPTIFMRRAKIYGRVYGTYDFHTAQLVIADAKLVKQICVEDFHLFTNRRINCKFHEIIDKMISVATNDEWKRLRKLVSPVFSEKKIRRMKPSVYRSIINAREYLNEIADTSKPLNLNQFWSRFTLEVIGRCCFATNFNSHKEVNNEFTRNVSEFFRPPGPRRLIAALLYFILPPQIFQLLPVDLFPTDSLTYLSNVVLKVLKERRRGESKHNDFLQLLIEAEKENKENDDAVNARLSDAEIIANTTIFFVAGYETTATLLQWCCYALAMNVEIQEILYDELKRKIGNKDDIDSETINKLTYLDAVVNETLRMFPPLLSTERTCESEVTLNDIGVKIPARTVVTIPIYAIHHDSKYFEEPEKFNPQRFLGNNRQKVEPYTFLPFGVGPRNCIAMNLALLQVKLALIDTVLNFKLVKLPKTQTKPEFLIITNFLISKDIHIGVAKR